MPRPISRCTWFRAQARGRRGTGIALIRNSRLVVIRSDAYHIAAGNADECAAHTLAFLEDQKI